MFLLVWHCCSAAKSQIPLR